MVTTSSLHAEVAGCTVMLPAVSTLFTHSSTLAFSTSAAVVPSGSVERSNRISVLAPAPILSAGSLPKFLVLSPPLATRYVSA